MLNSPLGWVALGWLWTFLGSSEEKVELGIIYLGCSRVCLYISQSFPCLVKLLLAVLGWKRPTHLVLGHEVAGSEVIWTCLKAPGTESTWEVEKKSVWSHKLVYRGRGRGERMREGRRSKSYSSYVEKPERYFCDNHLKTFMTLLILNDKAKFRNYSQYLLNHVRDKTELSFLS